MRTITAMFSVFAALLCIGAMLFTLGAMAQGLNDLSLRRYNVGVFIRE